MFSKAWLIVVATLGIGALAAVDVRFHPIHRATGTRPASARLSGMPSSTQLQAPATVAPAPRIVAAISLSCSSDMVEDEMHVAGCVNPNHAYIGDD